MTIEPLTLLVNTARGPYGAGERALLSAAHAGQIATMLQGCPAHAATPVRSVPGLAERTGVGAVLVKDESSRMGLGSSRLWAGRTRSPAC